MTIKVGYGDKGSGFIDFTNGNESARPLRTLGREGWSMSGGGGEPWCHFVSGT